MKETWLVVSAMNFAREKHGSQLDDNDKNYYETHVLQVVRILVALGISDPEILAAAHLHDTLEDTDATEAELRETFGDSVADLVMEVTHEGAKDKGYYFPRLHSECAILIKFADRLSNLSRMDAWNEKRRKHYLRKSRFWRSEPY